MVEIKNVSIFYLNDFSNRKRYTCIVEKGGESFRVNLETDGYRYPHMTEGEFIQLVKSS